MKITDTAQELQGEQVKSPEKEVEAASKLENKKSPLEDIVEEREIEDIQLTPTAVTGPVPAQQPEDTSRKVGSVPPWLEKGDLVLARHSKTLNKNAFVRSVDSDNKRAFLAWEDELSKLGWVDWKHIYKIMEESIELPVCLSVEMETNKCLSNNGGCWKRAKIALLHAKTLFVGVFTSALPCKLFKFKKWKNIFACQPTHLKGYDCPPDFHGDYKKHYKSIDECKEKTACQSIDYTCKHTCGNYNCTCKGGLLYMKEQDTCIDVEDKCYIKKIRTPHGWDVAFYAFSFLKGVMPIFKDVQVWFKAESTYTCGESILGKAEEGLDVVPWERTQSKDKIKLTCQHKNLLEVNAMSRRTRESGPWLTIGFKQRCWVKSQAENMNLEGQEGSEGIGVFGNLNSHRMLEEPREALGHSKVSERVQAWAESKKEIGGALYGSGLGYGPNINESFGEDTHRCASGYGSTKGNEGSNYGLGGMSHGVQMGGNEFGPDMRKEWSNLALWAVISTNLGPSE
ncbi:hypothetical protein L7F22_068940 [Adiantum nelumboides]|nr:hypothetical protein [Adiantum nelumboides]